MFGVKNDECPRADTIFDLGLMSNEVKSSCEIRTHTPDTDVVIKIPELLRGAWSPYGTGIIVNFGNPRTRASLHFSDVDLDKDWGGDIVNAYSDGKFVGFSVGSSSCVQAELN
jgi:hypothetical protein